MKLPVPPALVKRALPGETDVTHDDELLELELLELLELELLELELLELELLELLDPLA